MKFRFRPALKEIKLPKASISTKVRLRLKGSGTLRAVRCKKLARNYSAESFGMFEEEKRKSRFKIFWNSISSSFKNVLNRIKEKKNRYTKKSRISPSTLFGALCGALSIAVISGAIVAVSLFFGHIGSYTDISIPNLISMTEQEATSYATDIFEYTVVYKSNPQMPSNTVTSQSPLPDVTRKLYGNGEKIKLTLTVNSSQPTLTAPSFVGKSLRDALISLKSADIGVRVIKEYSSTVPFGTIIYSSVSEGTVLKKGDSITLHSSLGKQTTYSSVPSLIGLNEYEATNKLNSLNLEVGEISYQASKQPIGTVISQTVAPDTSLKEKSKVSFTLSGGVYYQN